MIEVLHLKKMYGSKTAVDDLSFTVEKNQIYGFLGPNGAGKSTTMNIITGCLSATEGTVSIGGYDIFEESLKAKSQIGYLPEQPPLYMDMTPKEYLTFVAEAKKIKKISIPAAVDNVMKKTSLTDVKNRLIKNLSKGYKQRVGIAGAILGNPPVVILDEPTVGLDPKQIIEIRSLIKSLKENHTVILSSHILAEVNEVCDRILIISGGKLIADDTPENLTNQFANGARLNVSVRTDAATAKRILSDITNRDTNNSLNMSINSAGEISSFSITLKNEDNSLLGYDIRDDIFKSFSRENISILEMSIKKATLEQVFIELTSEDITSEADINSDSDMDIDYGISTDGDSSLGSDENLSAENSLKHNNNNEDEWEEITDESDF